jgi:hypothetical protein
MRVVSLLRRMHISMLNPSLDIKKLVQALEAIEQKQGAEAKRVA